MRDEAKNLDTRFGDLRNVKNFHFQIRQKRSKAKIKVLVGGALRERRVRSVNGENEKSVGSVSGRKLIQQQGPESSKGPFSNPPQLSVTLCWFTPMCSFKPRAE